MAAIGMIGGIFSMLGSIVGAAAMQKQAKAERNAAEYNAQVQEKQAMEERASAQRKALEERRKKDVTLSNLQARAAASGGGAGVSDPTVISLATDIEGRGEYGALLEMYTGESRARGREDEAALQRYIGETKAQASEAKATGMILGGIGGLFGKFG